MPQPNVVLPIQKNSHHHIICIAELLFLILGSAKITLAQASVTPAETGIKKLVYQVQVFKGGGDLIYGLPGGSRPETSDIYEQVGQDLDAKQLMQGGQDPAWSAS